jgi:hypothetical protein
VNEAARLLGSSKAILLVDWPTPAVPRTLLEAGFEVFGYSPSGYSKADLVDVPPKNTNAKSIFPSEGMNENGYLTFQKLGSPPTSVDVVVIYRPPEELPKILNDQVLPLKAKAVWLLRPSASPEERAMVEKHGLQFIENSNLLAAEVGKARN